MVQKFGEIESQEVQVTSVGSNFRSAEELWVVQLQGAVGEVEAKVQNIRILRPMTPYKHDDVITSYCRHNFMMSP